MLFNESHPELCEGEVFLGNFRTYDRSFFDCCWKTKRMGNNAYDKFGNLLENVNRLRPVFVQKKELDKAGIKLTPL